jgi:PhnB protein
MSARLNPYLGFAGEARQAMEFYRDVFGGTLTLKTYGDFGHPDASLADRIMHSMLETPSGFTLMAADNPPEMPTASGSNISVTVSGDDESELRGYWEKLSADGSVSAPFEKQMWGDIFGMCTDRFGTPWMIDVAQPQG